MLTREETIKIFENCRCGAGDCNDCPMECDGNGNGFDELSSAVLHYLKEPKETEPAPAATGTSSEVSKDTDNIHIDDSILLYICQEGLCTVAQNRNADYQIGYADAVLDVIKKLKRW